MANRTIEVYGWVQSATTCSANVTFNGNVVHSGPVPIVATQPEIDPPNGFSEGLFTFQIPISSESETFPMTIAFNGGEQALVQRVLTNYSRLNNPVYTQEQWLIVANVTPSTRAERNAIMIPLATPALTAEEINVLETANTTSPESQAIMNSHGIGYHVSNGPAVNKSTHLQGQAKTNVVVNGTAVTPGTEPPGEWGYNIPFVEGVGTISFDLVVDPGLE